MICADIGTGVCTFILFLLSLFSALEIWLLIELITKRIILVSMYGVLTVNPLYNISTGIEQVKPMKVAVDKVSSKTVQKTLKVLGFS